MAIPDAQHGGSGPEIAALRWQLAEREAELAEARAQQAATAEVLQVINSSPGNLAPVFDAVLGKAMGLCGASFGILRTYDADLFHTAAMHGVPPAYAAFLISNPQRVAPGTLAARLLDGAPVVQVVDLAAEQIYQTGEPHRRALVDLGGARTSLAVPLKREGSIVGAIQIYRQHSEAFTDRQIALVQSFAAQAVIAMENAHLITETREALDRQTATAEVLGVINSSPGDLGPVFDTILEKALALCDAVHGYLYKCDGDHFHPLAAKGEQPSLDRMSSPGSFRPDPGSPFARMLAGEAVVHIADFTDAEHPRAASDPWRAMGALSGIRSALWVALRKEEVLLGTFVLYRHRVRPFTDKQITLLQNFAAQAVIAMENARLLGELRARTEEVAAWNRELEDRVAVQLGELERVGRLKRFLAPQLAEALVAGGDEGILETHRRDIVVVFCDLRGFTAFAETAEPEEVLDLLREYHATLGPIVSASEGTLDHFSGDGIMVFFNDPVPIPDASERAVRMAIAMRTAMARLQAQWRRQGREIGFGVGVARGYATLGQIGFADRIDYTAIGTVCNVAARLCAEATDRQILISRRVAAAVEDVVQIEAVGDIALKGLMQAVAVFNVVGAIPTAIQPDRAPNVP